ncbi:MAG: YybS family protein [Methylococcaceae bacterium]|nr:YybS family protein [Methylococcaceae bacterium]MDD1607600.1 YybS family protein [Methylococcaceae bacterium]MDD1616677.1 YybS family protein [Methylococcaceae bacterium]OYV17119.1 MAG: hypothetical protein CG439_1818 [Methylococcaceae bacterium NSP1-2]
MSFLAAFIMRGRMQAIMIASSLALISLVMHPLIKPLVIIVSFATIALVTLRKGTLEGLYVLLSATGATALLVALLVGDASFLLLMLVSCLTMWLPVWVCAIVLREGRYLSLAIEVAVMCAVLGVVGFYGYATDPAATWQDMFMPLLQMLPEDPSVEGMRDQMKVISHYMTGIMAASTLFIVLFGLFLGRWWQWLLYKPEGFKQEFLSLRTGSRLAIVSILIIIMAKTTSGLVSEVAWNIIILLFVLYLFIGTSVLHTLLANKKHSNYMIPLFYVTLFLIPHIMLPVALVGLFDAWLNLRKIQSAPTH